MGDNRRRHSFYFWEFSDLKRETSLGSFRKSQSDGGETASADGGLLLWEETDGVLLKVGAVTPEHGPWSVAGGEGQMLG